jgi:hypothetical protein
MNLKLTLLFALFVCLSLPASPQKDCGTNWLGNDAVGGDPDLNYAATQQRLYSAPNMEMPDPTPKPNVGTASKPPENNNKTSAVAPTIPAKPQPMFVDGKWAVQLDQGNGFMDLRLVQNPGISPEEVMVFGTLGSKKITVTGSGSVDNETLRMTAKTVVADKINKIDRKYELELFKANDTLSGGYQIFEGVQITKGNATAIRA